MTDNNFFHEKTNHDGRPILEIKSFEDIETLKGYRERKENVRIVIKPTTCTDDYKALVEAINNVANGVISEVYNISFKKDIKN